jgi:hypothetical protein
VVIVVAGDGYSGQSRRFGLRLLPGIAAGISRVITLHYIALLVSLFQQKRLGEVAQKECLLHLEEFSDFVEREIFTFFPFVRIKTVLHSVPQNCDRKCTHVSIITHHCLTSVYYLDLYTGRMHGRVSLFTL